MDRGHERPDQRRPTRADVRDYVRMRAPSFFPELASSAFEVVPKTHRRRSTTELHRFDLVSGHGVRDVVVKVHTGNGARGASLVPHGPRFEPCPDPETAAHAEFEAMAAIHAFFHGRGAEGFGAVRALDVCPDRHMIVMEGASGESLESLLARCHRFARRPLPERVENACRNAGRWLRLFQSLPGLGRAGVSRPTRDDLLRGIGESASWLIDADESPRLVETTVKACEQAIVRSCPVESVMGIGHGDFWSGNILVDEAGVISVIDTYARWRTPVHQDAGYFLSGLHLTPRRIFTAHGWNSSLHLARFRAAFLSGFLDGQTAHYVPVCLFEIHCVLNRWAIAARNFAQSEGVDRSLKAAKMSFRRLAFADRLRVLSGELERHG